TTLSTPARVLISAWTNNAAAWPSGRGERAVVATVAPAAARRRTTASPTPFGSTRNQCALAPESDFLVSISLLLVSKSDFLVSISLLLVRKSDFLASISLLLVRKSDFLASISLLLVRKSDFLASISLLLVSKSDFRVADEQASSSDDLSTLAHPRMASAKVRWLPHSKKERLYKTVSRKMYFPTPLACLMGRGVFFQFKCATHWPRSCLS